MDKRYTLQERGNILTKREFRRRFHCSPTRNAQSLHRWTTNLEDYMLFCFLLVLLCLREEPPDPESPQGQISTRVRKSAKPNVFAEVTKKRAVMGIDCDGDSLIFSRLYR